MVCPFTSKYWTEVAKVTSDPANWGQMCSAWNKRNQYIADIIENTWRNYEWINSMSQKISEFDSEYDGQYEDVMKNVVQRFGSQLWDLGSPQFILMIQNDINPFCGTDEVFPSAKLFDTECKMTEMMDIVINCLDRHLARVRTSQIVFNICNASLSTFKARDVTSCICHAGVSRQFKLIKGEFKK